MMNVIWLVGRNSLIPEGVAIPIHFYFYSLQRQLKFSLNDCHKDWMYCGYEKFMELLHKLRKVHTNHQKSGFGFIESEVMENRIFCQPLSVIWQQEVSGWYIFPTLIQVLKTQFHIFELDYCLLGETWLAGEYNAARDNGTNIWLLRIC